MDSALAEQIATQEQLFALLITEPDGVNHERDELAGVPVEWTVPREGFSDEGLVVMYLHGPTSRAQAPTPGRPNSSSQDP
jgi:hypothetical protein